ncbi:hypothetical protein [Microcoleus sp. S13_C5]|uniref:hypothetical protein n=1 Tax=Microcoleus sp. S13_C5 TaxID=3055411 RepID=UPI002FD79FB7
MQPSGIDVQSAANAVRLIKQAQSVRQGPPQAVMFHIMSGRLTMIKLLLPATNRNESNH